MPKLRIGSWYRRRDVEPARHGFMNYIAIRVDVRGRRLPMRAFDEYDAALAYARERLHGWVIECDGSQIADSKDVTLNAAYEQRLKSWPTHG